MLNYAELKKLLYALETFTGLVFLFFSWVLIQCAHNAQEPISYLVSALVLFVVGLLCILFGVEAYFFRDDPDVWR